MGSQIQTDRHPSLNERNNKYLQSPHHRDNEREAEDGKDGLRHPGRPVIYGGPVATERLLCESAHPLIAHSPGFFVGNSEALHFVQVRTAISIEDIQIAAL